MSGMVKKMWLPTWRFVLAIALSFTTVLPTFANDGDRGNELGNDTVSDVIEGAPLVFRGIEFGAFNWTHDSFDSPADNDPFGPTPRQLVDQLLNSPEKAQSLAARKEAQILLQNYPQLLPLFEYLASAKPLAKSSLTNSFDARFWADINDDGFFDYGNDFVPVEFLFYYDLFVYHWNALNDLGEGLDKLTFGYRFESAEVNQYANGFLQAVSIWEQKNSTSLRGEMPAALKERIVEAAQVSEDERSPSQKQLLVAFHQWGAARALFFHQQSKVTYPYARATVRDYNGFGTFSTAATSADIATVGAHPDRAQLPTMDSDPHLLPAQRLLRLYSPLNRQTLSPEQQQQPWGQRILGIEELAYLSRTQYEVLMGRTSAVENAFAEIDLEIESLTPLKSFTWLEAFAREIDTRAFALGNTDPITQLAAKESLLAVLRRAAASMVWERSANSLVLRVDGLQASDYVNLYDGLGVRIEGQELPIPLTESDMADTVQRGTYQASRSIIETYIAVTPTVRSLFRQQVPVVGSHNPFANYPLAQFFAALDAYPRSGSWQELTSAASWQEPKLIDKPHSSGDMQPEFYRFLEENPAIALYCEEVGDQITERDANALETFLADPTNRATYERKLEESRRGRRARGTFDTFCVMDENGPQLMSPVRAERFAHTASGDSWPLKQFAEENGFSPGHLPAQVETRQRREKLAAELAFVDSASGLLRAFQQAVRLSPYLDADINDDGRVDNEDLTRLSQIYRALSIDAPTLLSDSDIAGVIEAEGHPDDW